MLQDSYSRRYSVNSLNLTEKYNSKHYSLFFQPQDFFFFSPAIALIFLNITTRTACRFPMSPTYAPYVTYTCKSSTSFYVLLSWLYSLRWIARLFWTEFQSFNWSPRIMVFLLQFPPPNPFWSLFCLPWYPIMYPWTQIPNFIPRWIKLDHTSWTHRNKQLKLFHTATQLFITILGICMIHRWFICI